MTPFCIGLTGGIGCGKTTVSDRFAALGVAVIDTDEIARVLTAPGGEAVAKIEEAFGSEFIDGHGALDRSRMRGLVFADPDAKRALEKILHPLIRDQVAQRIKAAQSSPYVVLVVPLLFETDAYRDLVRRTLVVDCDEALQVTRTRQRSGLSEADVRAIIATQVPRKTRLEAADDIIVNDGDMRQLDARIAELHRHYLALAAAC